VDIDLCLFEPFDRLVRILLRGRPYDVPENNNLLRGLQYLVGDAISVGRFCWNNECGNCEVSCRLPGRDGLKRLRGCQALAEEGMEIVDVSPDLDLVLPG